MGARRTGAAKPRSYVIPNAALSDPYLSSASKVVLAYVIAHGSAKGVQQIAAGTGLSRRTIDASLRLLRSADWIETAMQKKKGFPAKRYLLVTVKKPHSKEQP